MTKSGARPRIYVLHENDSWVEPLRAAFQAQDLPYEEWFLDRGTVPLDQAPPEGVFYNRMSASSHTRGHRYGPELTAAVLDWLEAAGRRVVNTRRALALEVSKVAQYAALARAGIRVLRTLAAVGREAVLTAAQDFGPGPLILKPNRGGKGLGVRLFPDRDALAAYLDGPAAAEEAPIDGIWLLQDYVRAAEPVITRCEFIGGAFLYAVRVDTSAGFELCPADVCTLEGLSCPAEAPAANRFTIQAEADPDLIASYRRFLAANGIEIAGIEFIRDRDGRTYTYDINTNTNYNARAEAEAGLTVGGIARVAAFLGRELAGLEVPTKGPRPPALAAAV